MLKQFLPIIIVGFFFLFGNRAMSQCPQFFDFQGTLSSTPQYVSCSGGAYAVNLTPNLAIGNYSIDWGDGSAPTAGNGWAANTSITHNYAVAVANYTVTINLPDVPCVVVGQVVMEEPSNASIQIPFGGLTSTCAPGSLDFINSSTDVSTNTVFTWDFGDGSPIQTFNYTNAGTTITHTYLPTTVNCQTQVILTAENVCNTIQGGQSTATFNPIRIWDVDDAAIAPSATLLCYPDTTVTLQNATNRNCVPQGNIAQRYEYWNLGDYWGLGTDSIIDWTAWPPTFPLNMAYPGVGSYTAMLIDSSFCGRDTAFVTIQIVNPPVASLTNSKDTVCQGESITFNNLSGGGANSFFWNFGDGSGWNAAGTGAVNHTYNTAGDFTIQLAAFIGGGSASCTDTATVDIHVLPTPTPNFNFDANNGCDTLTISFSDLSSADVVNWTWDFDNGNTSANQNPAIQFYNTAGNYNVKLDVSSANGCQDSLTQVINVFQTPTPLFSATNVCQNDTTNFTDMSTSALGDPIISWGWNFGDGNSSILQSPSHAYASAGSVDVELTVNTAFCTATDTVTVVVETLPAAGFTTNLSAGCAPALINFTNTSSANAVNFYWNFGDGDTSTMANPNHLFLNNFGHDTIYTVQLIAQTLFGCADTITQLITILHNPTAAFTHNAILNCAPLIVNFNASSLPGITYEWDFGDGSPFNNTQAPSHTYQNTTPSQDTNTVRLVITSTNGCTDTTFSDIIVYPEPIFDFVSMPDSGCSPLTVNFPFIGLGIANSWEWDFGDGSPIEFIPNPTHVYTNTAVNNLSFTVRLIASSSFSVFANTPSTCIDTSYSQVLVYPNPTASFIPTPLTQTYPNATVSLNNTSNPGAFQYAWDFGDLTTSNLQTPPNHTYATWGTYPIQLVVNSANNCADTFTQNIQILPPAPVASFQGPADGCEDLTVQFVNNSQYGNTYLWNFGDGGTSTAFEPSHTYTSAGVYTVSLTTFGGGGQDIEVQQSIINVYQRPNAFFTTNGSIVFIPDRPTILYNLSDFASSYLWDFGDGNSSTDESPEHYYTKEGLYDITLIASNPQNCTDTFVISNAVEAKIEGDIVVPNAFTPSENGGNGGVFKLNDTHNDVFFPRISGAEEYELNIFNKWGELLFVSKDVAIGWDGYYQNKLCKQDVYIYKIHVKFIDGRTESFVGDITLLR